MRKINNIVLHGSASSWGNKEFIHTIHTVERDWKDIGYNFIIYNQYPTYNSWRDKVEVESNDGVIVGGRDLDKDFNFIEEVGAHALGYNSNSIGVCLIGNKDKPITKKQYASCVSLCTYLINLLNIKVENVLGHYEVDPERKIDPYVSMWYFRTVLRNFMSGSYFITQNEFTYELWHDEMKKG